MNTLKDTPFEIVYTLLKVSNDDELMDRGIQMYLFIIVGSIFLSSKEIISYGKFVSSHGSNFFTLGFLSSITISARSTWMFGTMSSWVIPIFVVFYTPAAQKYNFCNCVGLAMYVLHYFNRSMIYPFQISDNAARAGLWYVLTLAAGGGFNGFMHAHYLMNIHTVSFNSTGFLGVAMYVIGVFINKYHDHLLTSLKRKSTGSGKSSYSIPIGGLFEYISCANYFGEILEWFGAYLLTKGVPQLLFAIFSSTFLVIRGVQTHRYYQQHFGENYPKGRKAIIPLLL